MGQTQHALGGLCGGEQQFTEMTESQEVRLAVALQFRRHVFQIGQAVFQNLDPLWVQPVRTVQKKYHTAADNRIKSHQLSLIRTGKRGPAVAAMRVPG